MWKANGKTTTLSLFLQSLFPKTDVLEEAVDLSYDRLLMNGSVACMEKRRIPYRGSAGKADGRSPLLRHKHVYL
jgi:hypothetical protein